MNENLTDEQRDDNDFPATKYKKTTHTFTTQELSELAPLEDAERLIGTFITLGAIIRKIKDNMVGSTALKRLALKESKDIRFGYDVVQNKIRVYEPRFWCTVCKNKIAEYKFEDKLFCEECRKTEAEKVVKPIDVKGDTKTKSKN